MTINLIEKSNVAYNVQHIKENSFKNKDKIKQNDTKLKNACKDFEAILINNMLSAMRKTINKEKFLGGGLKQEIFESMYDQEISSIIAHGKKTMGLGEMLYKQVSKNGDSRK